LKRARPIIAIDGPAGAGKSTVARRLAARLGFVFLDTGALYRAVALAAERRGIDWGDEAAVGALARELAAARAIELVPGAGAEPGGVRLGGEDVSAAIRTPALSMGASRVSAFAEVRAALLELQRGLGRDGGVVAEGRDIGTVVFPDAELKFFLTASVDERARRRERELVGRGAGMAFDQVRADVEQRDRQDRERAVAPLKRAADARLVDSTGLSADAVIDLLHEAVRAASEGA
jgi:cytidylate kinase